MRIGQRYQYPSMAGYACLRLCIGMRFFVGILDDILKGFQGKKETPNSKWVTPIDIRREVDYSVKFRAKEWFIVISSAYFWAQVPP